MEIPLCCTLCPRRCRADRRTEPGLCNGGPRPRVARAALHHWEEPCISGSRGSGTVFFGGCGLGCVFCQNHAINMGEAGQSLTVEELAAVYLDLQRQGAYNLNLVTATHYRPWALAALALARRQGLVLPMVWNSGGYEAPEAMAELIGIVDIWLLDVKFKDNGLSAALAGAPDYFEMASGAARAACEAAGPPVMDADGLLTRGVILRLLVLPGHSDDAIAILQWMADALPAGGFLLSLMCQYTPPREVTLPSPLNRRLASYEYRQVTDAAHSLGLTQGYTQDRTSAQAAYIPPFEV